MTDRCKIINADVLDGLRGLPSQSVNCCITSPPYYALRDYGIEGQIGLESTPGEYVARMVAVFCEVRRVLRDDGTLWLNLGDSFVTAAGATNTVDPKSKGRSRNASGLTQPNRGLIGRRAFQDEDGAVPASARKQADYLKPKDLVGIPWMTAFALRADGWYLRMDCIWSKPNAMPESVTDRPTKAHEYVFLLSKSERYWYDAAAIAEPGTTTRPELLEFGPRIDVGHPGHIADRKRAGRADKQGDLGKRTYTGFNDRWDAAEDNGTAPRTRNKRSVWTIATEPYPEAHFATFPTALVKPCVLAGCPEGGTVLDPFCGSGTTGVVALQYGRKFIGIELNPAYVALAEKRLEPALSQGVLALA